MFTGFKKKKKITYDRRFVVKAHSFFGCTKYTFINYSDMPLLHNKIRSTDLFSNNS